MSISVLGVSFDDQDGSIAIEWYDDSEQKPQGGIIKRTIISRDGQEDWENVGYYASELRGDVEELVHWFNKYTEGRVP